jgi:hypothetical protein
MDNHNMADMNRETEHKSQDETSNKPDNIDYYSAKSAYLQDNQPPENGIGEQPSTGHAYANDKQGMISCRCAVLELSVDKFVISSVSSDGRTPVSKDVGRRV